MDRSKRYAIPIALAASALVVAGLQGGESSLAKAWRCGIPTLGAAGQCWSAWNSSEACVGLVGSENPAAFLACPWAGFQVYQCGEQAVDAYRCWKGAPPTEPGVARAVLADGQAGLGYKQCIRDGLRGDFKRAAFDCPVASYRGWKGSTTTARVLASQNIGSHEVSSRQGAHSTPSCSDRVAAAALGKAPSRGSKSLPSR